MKARLFKVLADAIFKIISWQIICYMSESEEVMMPIVEISTITALYSGLVECDHDIIIIY